MAESVRQDVRLYLDSETRKTFDDEANSVGLSFSAYLRVVGRVFRAWAESKIDTPMDVLRKRIREIIIEQERKV